MEVNKNNEYTAAKNLQMPNGIIYQYEAHTAEVINAISPNRLIEGGAAILQIERINHQKEIAGKRHRSPLVKYILRVWVDSYVKFARANIQEEQRPCAIIITKAPFQPQVESNEMPKITRAICPTDE